MRAWQLVCKSLWGWFRFCAYHWKPSCLKTKSFKKWEGLSSQTEGTKRLKLAKQTSASRHFLFSILLLCGWKLKVKVLCFFGKNKKCLILLVRRKIFQNRNFVLTSILWSIILSARLHRAHLPKRQQNPNASQPSRIPRKRSSTSITGFCH